MGVKPHVRERLAILASWPSLLGAWQLSKLRSQPMVCTNQWSVPRHNHAMKTSQKRAHSYPGSWVQNEAKSVTLADLGKAGRRWVLIQLDTASYRGGPPAVLAGLRKGGATQTTTSYKMGPFTPRAYRRGPRLFASV